MAKESKQLDGLFHNTLKIPAKVLISVFAARELISTKSGFGFVTA